MATQTGVQGLTQGVQKVGALAVGPAGALIKGLLKLSATLSPVAVAAASIAAQSVTVTGVKAGDIIMNATKPTEQAGLALVAERVSADNTVVLSFANTTGGSITPTAGEAYTFLVWRP